jgi:hypothetical protein
MFLFPDRQESTWQHITRWDAEGQKKKKKKKEIAYIVSTPDDFNDGKHS